MTIEWQEYNERRQRLFSKLPNASLALLSSSQRKFRNSDTEYPFRQDSYFYYLTGFCEPQAVLVLTKDKAGKTETILFCQDRDKLAETWTGRRLGPDQAPKALGVDRAFRIEMIDVMIQQLLKEKKQVFCSMEQDAYGDKRLLKWLQDAGINAEAQQDVLPLISEDRLFKSNAEIAVMREAATVSARAHMLLMKACKVGMQEYELEALFTYECLRNGCRALAYMPIVGGGENACTLHYVENNDELKEGDLVLVDAGGEYDYYAADITRTYPVNGKFSDDQRTLYEIVLKAQRAVIERVQPKTPWVDLQKTALEVMIKGLLEKEIIKGNLKTILEEKSYKAYYMHGSGHWLGLDVHDVGDYEVKNKSRLLEPGMVLTVEPGIYFAKDYEEVDPRWRGMGIRIEDDVLVTADGCDVLSKDVPTDPDAIEALMKGS